MKHDRKCRLLALTLFAFVTSISFLCEVCSAEKYESKDFSNPQIDVSSKVNDGEKRDGNTLFPTPYRVEIEYLAAWVALLGVPSLLCKVKKSYSLAKRRSTLNSIISWCADISLMISQDLGTINIQNSKAKKFDLLKYTTMKTCEKINGLYKFCNKFTVKRSSLGWILNDLKNMMGFLNQLAINANQRRILRLRVEIQRYAVKQMYTGSAQVPKKIQRHLRNTQRRLSKAYSKNEKYVVNYLQGIKVKVDDLHKELAEQLDLIS